MYLSSFRPPKCNLCSLQRLCAGQLDVMMQRELRNAQAKKKYAWHAAQCESARNKAFVEGTGIETVRKCSRQDEARVPAPLETHTSVFILLETNEKTWHSSSAGRAVSNAGADPVWLLLAAACTWCMDGWMPLVVLCKCLVLYSAYSTCKTVQMTIA